MKIKSLLLAIFTFLVINSYTQVSHPSGYYQEDSVFFEVYWDKENGQEILISVNRYTSQSFVTYNGGIWLKDRSFTENSWENIHNYRVSKGSIDIAFYGKGLNDITVSGNNSDQTGMRFKLQVIDNTPEGDVFSAYRFLPNGNLELIVPTLLATDELDTEMGWNINFGSKTGYTVGDYWIITALPNIIDEWSCHYPSNLSQPRGLLHKVNTIGVKLIDSHSGGILKDSVYIIGFGKIPHNHHVFFATADSFDVINLMLSSEKLKERKIAHLHIFNSEGKIEFKGKVEWDIAANSSRCLPNKGVEFLPKGYLGSKNIKSSLYGVSDEKIKKIKLRVGGSGQYTYFGLNEIVQRVLDYDNYYIGGVKNTVATWYLNGSYWSLGFPQEQPKTRYIERVLGISKDSVDILSISPILYIDSIWADTVGENDNYHIMFDSTTKVSFLNNSHEFLIFPSNLYKKIFIAYDSTVQKKVLVGRIQEGAGKNLTSVFSKLFSLASKESPVTIKEFETIVNIDNWMRFISMIHFHNLLDCIHNNTTLFIDNDKISPLMSDFDNVRLNKLINYDHWDYIFGVDSSVNYKTIINLIIEIIENSPQLQERLVLVYQDVLNTSLNHERTVPIVELMKDKVMNEYETHHNSWGGVPNGGHDAIAHNHRFFSIIQYYKHRPDIVYHYIADKFMTDKAFDLNNLNQIQVVFDNIPKGIVKLQLNSLNLEDNYNGRYFPNPDIQISYKVQDGYNVIIKEFPKFGNNFELSLDKDVVLTFQLQ